MNVSRLQAPGVREAEALMHLVADQIAELPWEHPHEVTGRVDRSMKLELKASKSTLPDVNLVKTKPDNSWPLCPRRNNNRKNAL